MSTNSAGWLSGNVCFDNNQDAIDHYYNTLPVTPYSTATYTITPLYIKSAGTWYSTFKTVYVNATPTQYTTYKQETVLPSFPSCYTPLQSFSDGVTIGWEFGAVLAACSFVLFVRRVLF